MSVKLGLSHYGKNTGWGVREQGARQQLDNEELHYFYSIIIRVSKSNTKDGLGILYV
jgi:hypothetical protein